MVQSTCKVDYTLKNTQYKKYGLLLINVFLHKMGLYLKYVKTLC